MESQKNTDQGIDRLPCNVYLHGSTVETGEVLVYPRKTTDSWQIPLKTYSLSGKANQY